MAKLSIAHAPKKAKDRARARSIVLAYGILWIKEIRGLVGALLRDSL